jgi:hypothetical protein
MAGVVNMDEIIKILDKIEEMTTVGQITIKSGDIEISVTKTTQQTIHATPLPVFSKASERIPTATKSNTAPGQASEFQVKYARDLMAKVFGEDEKGGLDFLAHTLEIPLSDVPEIEGWNGLLSQDMVGNIIDALSPMHKSKRSDF